MDFESLLLRVVLALGIGLLFGLERGWHTRNTEAGKRTAGIRTFALTALSGGICGAISRTWQGDSIIAASIFLAASFLTYAAIISLFSREENRAEGRYSATTAVAGALSFLLGAQAVIGDMYIAAAAAVAACSLLAIREELHSWIRKITWPELRSALLLLAMTFIILPITPNENMGPFGGVNPRQIWIITILLATVSFLGYVSVKQLGGRWGTLVGAAAGGLVSSTAVTIANARKAAVDESASQFLSAGVAIATAVSFLRVIGVAAALQPRLIIFIGPTLASGAVAAFSISIISAKLCGSAIVETDAKLRYPFQFGSILAVATALAAMIVLGRAIGQNFGVSGAIIGSIIVGMVDVDVVVVSMSQLAADVLSPQTAAYAILAAVASDTVTKIAVGAAIGRGRFAMHITLMAGICFTVAGLGLGATVLLVPL